jgi:putative glycosyltransferase (TIGR04372 family)
MIAYAGTFRRLTAASTTVRASGRVSNTDGGSAQRERLGDAALALAVPIYRALIRRRRRVKPVLSAFSRWFDRALEDGRIGDRLLAFAYREIQAGRCGLARATLASVRVALMLAAQFHLGASQRARAIRCARIINLLFRSEIRSRRGLLAKQYFQALLLSTSYERIVREVPEPERCEDYFINLAVGSAHLYMLHQKHAQYFLKGAIVSAHDGSAEARRRLGCSYLLDHDEDRATQEFQRSVEICPASVLAHHNYAGRYDIATYRPKAWELADAGRLLIYDNLIRLGEEFYLLGRFEDSMRTYQRAFRYQGKLCGSALPAALVRRLAQQCRSFVVDRSVRLLSYEWVTQIGHMGFLAWHMRMVRLGMLTDVNYVLLAPSHKVANVALLNCFEDLCCVVRDSDLVDELFPYQRLFGDQFIGFPADGDLAEPWAHAAARAQRTWTDKKLPPLLALPERDHDFGRKALARLGVPDGAWFVGLHVREGGFHSDGSGTTIAHRSASIEDYFPAISEITARGGWVIRLGDSSMTLLPTMENVVDYAHSAAKSPQMDVFLMATSRFVIGTTSGLTTATQAFGTPMLLVNCISNDCQFWTPETDFIVKPLLDVRRRRWLTLGETYRQPLQSWLINDTILARRGYEVRNNSADDIRDAVAYKLDYMGGSAQRLTEDHSLMRRYRATLAHNPLMFGSALPARPFLENHPELLDSGAEIVAAK